MTATANQAVITFTDPEPIWFGNPLHHHHHHHHSQAHLQQQQQNQQVNQTNYAVESDQYWREMECITAQMQHSMRIELDEHDTIEPDVIPQPLLHTAVAANSLDLAKRLVLNDKLDINLRDLEGNTPVMIAATHGHVSIIDWLIGAGAELSLQNIHDNSALHEAAWRGFSQTVQLLCENRVRLHQKNKQGHTALHLASQKGHNQCSRILLLSGCKPNIKNNFGDTPLHTASRYGHVGVARILISAFANVNEVNENGDTALHIAAAMCRRKLVKILLESGSNPTIVNRQNETPMSLALQKSALDIQELIASPPPLKPIYYKQQQLYMRPLQGSSYKDIYCAVPRSDQSTANTTTRHQRAHRASRKPCKSDFSLGEPGGPSHATSGSSVAWPKDLATPPEVVRADFPPPKLETLPREPLGKGEQYYVDLSGHIHKGPIEPRKSHQRSKKKKEKL